MYMTIQQILREKNLSRYQLSKKSGVPWATLADICSGKTTLSRCSAGTLMKLSSTLDIPMEQLITLTVEKPQMHGGKPADQTYLEKNLPASLDKALREYIQGEKDKILRQVVTTQRLSEKIGAAADSGATSPALFFRGYGRERRDAPGAARSGGTPCRNEKDF